MSNVLTFLQDPATWRIVVAILVPFILTAAAAPKGILQQLLGDLERWAARRLPANQYVLLKSLADDVVRGVYQFGSSQGWDDENKAQNALSALKSQATAHKIDLKVFDEPMLKFVLEGAWNRIKQVVQSPPLVVSMDEASSHVSSFALTPQIGQVSSTDSTTTLPAHLSTNVANATSSVTAFGDNPTAQALTLSPAQRSQNATATAPVQMVTIPSVPAGDTTTPTDTAATAGEPATVQANIADQTDQSSQSSQAALGMIAQQTSATPAATATEGSQTANVVFDARQMPPAADVA